MQQPNYTCMLKNLLKLYCISTWDTLWCFGVFLVFFPFDAKEPNEAQKNILKEEILQIITENFMRLLLDMVNQNIQGVLKKSQDTKIKKYIYKKTQKQINELIGPLKTTFIVFREHLK
jgi:hypothetical protein